MASALDSDEVLRSSSKGGDKRLARLLISGGAVLLREVFDIKCPPSNLPTILDREVKEFLDIVESSMKRLEKEVQYLRQEVREDVQDVKIEPVEEVKSIAQERQRLEQHIEDELGEQIEYATQNAPCSMQDIKCELGKESTAQEVQPLRQEFRNEARDKDRSNVAGQTNSSAGGLLVDFFLYIFYK